MLHWHPTWSRFMPHSWRKHWSADLRRGLLTGQVVQWAPASWKRWVDGITDIEWDFAKSDLLNWVVESKDILSTFCFRCQYFLFDHLSQYFTYSMLSFSVSIAPFPLTSIYREPGLSVVPRGCGQHRHICQCWGNSMASWTCDLRGHQDSALRKVLSLV